MLLDHAGRQLPRYLTVDGTTGLADRIVADVSGLALAILTQRAFLLTDHLGGPKVYTILMMHIADWLKAFGVVLNCLICMQAPLSTVFCSPHIQWQHRPHGSDNLTTVKCLWEMDNRDFEPPCTFGKGSSSVDIDFVRAFGDHEMVQITAQNGLLSWLFSHPTYASQLQLLGLTPDNAYGCLSNFIFQAAPALQQQLPPNVMQAIRTSTVIGIQIRYWSLMHVASLLAAVCT